MTKNSRSRTPVGKLLSTGGFSMPGDVSGGHGRQDGKDEILHDATVTLPPWSSVVRWVRTMC